MIGYTLVGSNDLEKAKVFYDDLFEAIGIKRLMEFPNGGCAWGANWGQQMFGVGAPYDGQTATSGNGTMIALVMDERGKVDAIYDKAMALGGRCEGGPGVRGPEGDQAFYAAYFRDLDGNKLCAFRVGPAQ
ncbi:VOC family protein [Caulobacter sp.]|uniref:VOC family protein n=1 Tax=Caulobacter sp. TaxID=78 RepID=UPI002B4A86A7|nr:VOC family protein [Caulobacter sp.]HJV43269.1 VOC family protein [Caulobacter sp.]